MFWFYFIEFIIVAIISWIWVELLDKCKDVDRDKIEFP
jgi:hypothetical protein